MLDRNRTLWASWVIIDDDLRVFFSGDTGYFDGFKNIGEKYGPFDITLMETGAYDKKWPDVHMQPEEVLQAHRDLRGRWLLPIHNGTFDLAMHTWHEPFDRIAVLAEQQGVALTTPFMGEALNLKAPQPVSFWWWGGIMQQTCTTQPLKTASNSCGKVRNLALDDRNLASSDCPLESTACRKPASLSKTSLLADRRKMDR